MIWLRLNPEAYRLFYSAYNILKGREIGMVHIYLDILVSRSSYIEFIGYDDKSGIIVHIDLPEVVVGGEYEAHVDAETLARGLEAFAIFKIKEVSGVIDTEKDVLTLEGERVVKGKKKGKVTYILKLNSGRYYDIDIKEFEKLDYPTFISLDVRFAKDRIKEYIADYVVIYDKIYIISKTLDRLGNEKYVLLDTLDIFYNRELREPAVCSLANLKRVIFNIPSDAEVRLYYGNKRVLQVWVSYHGSMHIYIPQCEDREKVLNEFFKLIKVEEKEEVKEKVEEAKEEVRERKLDEFQRVLAKILAEKLTYYAKSKLLEKKAKLDEVNKIVSDLKEYIQSLAERIALKEITQKEAESELERKIEELMRRKAEKIKPIIEAVAGKLIYYARTKLLESVEPSEADKVLDELKSYIEELAEKVALNEITQKEAERLIDSKIEEMLKIDFSSILKKLTEVYKSYLRELGYSEDKITEIIEAVKPDIEVLAKEVAEGKMRLEEALERVKRLPPPVEKPTAEVAKPEVEEVIPEKPKEPEKKVINLESEEDILDVLNKEWPCIVTKGVYNCLKEKYILPPVTMRRLVEVFAKVAKLVLHDRKPKYVREWFITGYCPVYDDVIKMLFMFGLDSETFKNWFRNVYNRYKPSLEAKAKMKLPDYEIFYNDFKEFIINYKLLQ